MTYISEVEAAAKIKLTPNQMILLLQIYRGMKNDTHIITEEGYLKDMKYLLDNQLIEANHGFLYFNVTLRGTSRVMSVLEPE